MAPRREPFGHLWGNQVVPHPAPTQTQLEREFEQARRDQRRALVEQKWGNTQTLPGYADIGLTSPQTAPFQPFVNVGPFDEPQAIALEASYDPVFQMYLEYRITVGIGQAVATYNTSQLPSVLLCQQLQVEAKRADPGVLFPPQNISVWAAPYVPRSQPVPILSEVLNFPATQSLQVLPQSAPPRGATHVMVSADEVALDAVGSSTVFLRLSYRPFPETGAGGAVDVLHLMVAASRVGRTQPGLTATDMPNLPNNAPPTILPIPLGQVVQWQVRRIENANIGNHVVTWLRA